MGFDILSFLGGFGSGVAVTSAAYGIRQYRIRAKTEDTQLKQINRSMRRTADRRYSDDLVSYLQCYHLAGDKINLTDILIEPAVLADMREYDHDLRDPSPPLQTSTRVIPRIHDFPEIYSSYSLERTRIRELLTGSRHIALLGVPGSGKSTLLATMGLMALDQLSFHDVEEFEPENLADLDEDEREELDNAYRKTQERIRSQLSEIKLAKMREELKNPQLENVEVDISGPDIRSFLPVFFNIGSIEIDMNLYGIQVDPAEPVIRAFQDYAGTITARVAPVMLYRMLERGQCLVLIDGFDDLSDAERARVYPWLRSFMKTYGHNRVIITGPHSGYDPLVELGFRPAFMAPILQKDVYRLIKNWVKTWYALQGRTISEASDQQVINRMLEDNRNRTVMEITMKIYGELVSIEEVQSRRELYELFVRKHSPEDDDTIIILREIAKVRLDKEAPLKLEQLVEIATSATQTAENEEGNPNAETIVRAFITNGLFVQRASQTYDLRHQMLTAYLGGESLIYDMEHRLAEVATLPAWNQALGFAASEVNMLPAVREKLGGETDLLYSNLFDIVRWLPDSDPNSQWRGEILKRLSAAMVATSQYDTIRERATAALIASRDPNILFILRQGLRHANPVVRKLACVGLGALGAVDAVRELRSMIVDDNIEVQMAAAQALGAIGSEAALETMVQGLLEGEEGLRQAIGEALATIPGEGHAILRDAIEHDDMMVRRAAVFGLAKLQTMWAIDEMYRIMREDSQWYVRSAAESIFTFVQDPEEKGLKPFPAVDTLTWLNQWASNQEIPEDATLAQVVLHAFRTGQTQVRVLAAHALTYLDPSDVVKPLYGALSDRDEAVRSAAHQALTEIHLRATRPLPGIA